MIVTDKFAFVHLPKTGGTFVCEIIRKFFPSAREIGHHLPREFMPRQYAHLPVLGTIRNPWDFYVSYYHYICPRDAARTLVSWMTENGSLGFHGSTRNLLNLSENDERLNVLIDMLPEHIDYSRTYIPNVNKHTMRTVRGTGIGYYTFRFQEMFGNPDDVFFCRLESLRQDLIAFFEHIGATTEELCEYIRSAGKKNTTKHRHYSSYYTPELAELVLLRERPLIERFGYRFEQPCSDERGPKSVLVPGSFLTTQ